jgi:hypothetical protein
VTERWIEPRIAARLDDRLDTRLFKRLLSATSKHTRNSQAMCG